MLKLEVKNLAKRFGTRKVFAEISFNLETGQSLAITGPNGSGKTTLIKTILGLAAPSRGEAVLFRDEKKLDFDSYYKEAFLIAPYMNLYDTLTGKENLRFLSRLGGLAATDEAMESALTGVGLAGRGKDLVAGYSSGMKQRLKYAAALIKKPAAVFLDEPTSNLDDSGKEIAISLIREWKNVALVVIATNEKEESTLAERILELGP